MQRLQSVSANWQFHFLSLLPRKPSTRCVTAPTYTAGDWSWSGLTRR